MAEKQSNSNHLPKITITDHSHIYHDYKADNLPPQRENFPTPCEESSGVLPLNPTQFQKADSIYFQRCAGCHGSHRQGAIGPSLNSRTIHVKGEAAIKEKIIHGSAKGMPAFGDSGELPTADVDLITRYLFHEPSSPPAFGMAEAKQSWKNRVKVAHRPVHQENKLDLENMFTVTLRDTGEIALIDGESKKIVTIIKVGFSLHTARISGSGRYLYACSRNGTISLIDLFMKMPSLVSTVRVGWEAGSFETSKFHGYADKLAIAGVHAPNHYVLLQGETLEPLRIESICGMTHQSAQFHPHPQIVSIASSHYYPEFILTVKETGKLILTDYSNLLSLKTKHIQVASLLHKGGFDHSKRYFLVSANDTNEVAIIDVVEGRVEKVVPVGEQPHSGRGANFWHPKHGHVWATACLNDAQIFVISTEAKRLGVKERFGVVARLNGLEPGLFNLRAHPKSDHLYADYALSTDGTMSQCIAVFTISEMEQSKSNAACQPRLLPIAQWAGLSETDANRVVDPVFNRKGDEVWISVWNPKDSQSAIVVVDDKTLTLKQVIKDPRLATPTAKFNGYNTMHDIY
jgi:nitrite reductase (NO-forming) / hydroxylamine reductase